MPKPLERGLGFRATIAIDSGVEYSASLATSRIRGDGRSRTQSSSASRTDRETLEAYERDASTVAYVIRMTPAPKPKPTNEARIEISLWI